MVDLARRRLFTGGKRLPQPIYPPWSGDEALFLSRCSGCNSCLDACENAILQPGSGGIPVVNFEVAECVFCYACAQACPESLFLPQFSAPWSLKSVIGAGCLAKQAVECRSCQDSCEANAIRFRPSPVGIWQPDAVSDACTGCGACVSVCPTSVIRMEKGYAH